MKSLLLLLLTSPFLSLAQNVGIGTTSPVSRLQVNHSSTSNYGLQIVDSASNSSGSFRFRNLNRSSGLLLSGYSPDNFHRNQFLDIRSDSTFIASFRGNGTVGIRNLTPAFPLDVDGDINTTGSIRVNGISGTAGQVLTSNGLGGMSWSNGSQFNNFMVFRAIFPTSTNQTWVVPDNVTRLMVEIWAGGGGANSLGGGGGGGTYAKVIFIVTPGQTVNVLVGQGGAGASGGSNAADGGNSSVGVGSQSIVIVGGDGATSTNPGGNSGGVFSASTGLAYLLLSGKAGEALVENYAPLTSIDFLKMTKYGKGGDAPNADNTGGNGGFATINANTTALLTSYNGSAGLTPGGGGGSGRLNGLAGGNGMVIIHY